MIFLANWPIWCIRCKFNSISSDVVYSDGNNDKIALYKTSIYGISFSNQSLWIPPVPHTGMLFHCWPVVCLYSVTTSIDHSDSGGNRGIMYRMGAWTHRSISPNLIKTLTNWPTLSFIHSIVRLTRRDHYVEIAMYISTWMWKLGYCVISLDTTDSPGYLYAERQSSFLYSSFSSCIWHSHISQHTTEFVHA